jgi:hypothetical protein
LRFGFPRPHIGVGFSFLKKQESIAHRVGVSPPSGCSMTSVDDFVKAMMLADGVDRWSFFSAW